tara:strand:+ start:3267 stop:3866 length:600 start_codon:yes stop_codon:yes gene_type:complete
MIKLGLDFDNTLITYDSLFKKAAVEKNLIPIEFPESKKLIRNYLREKDRENSFTLLQGEVYGSRISEASQAEGMFEALKNFQDQGRELFIISHKTKSPYAGPKYDLHAAALTWLKKNLFFENSGINIPRENVYFELTKENKIKRIESLGCTHFIDDLPEILEMINPNIKRILYSPLDNNSRKLDFINMHNWSDLNKQIF